MARITELEIVEVETIFSYETLAELQYLGPFEGIYRGKVEHYDWVLRRNTAGHCIDIGRRPDREPVERIKPFRTDTSTDYTANTYRVYAEIVDRGRRTLTELVAETGLTKREVSDALGLLKRYKRIECVDRVKCKVSKSKRPLMVWAAVGA